MREDACKVLGVKSDATPDEIKRAYFRLIRQHTPDRDPEEFQKIRRRMKRCGMRKYREKKRIL